MYPSIDPSIDLIICLFFRWFYKDSGFHQQKFG